MPMWRSHCSEKYAYMSSEITGAFKKYDFPPNHQWHHHHHLSCHHHNHVSLFPSWVRAMAARSGGRPSLTNHIPSMASYSSSVSQISSLSVSHSTQIIVIIIGVINIYSTCIWFVYHLILQCVVQCTVACCILYFAICCIAHQPSCILYFILCRLYTRYIACYRLYSVHKVYNIHQTWSFAR